MRLEGQDSELSRTGKDETTESVYQKPVSALDPLIFLLGVLIGYLVFDLVIKRIFKTH